MTIQTPEVRQWLRCGHSAKLGLWPRCSHSTRADDCSALGRSVEAIGDDAMIKCVGRD